VNEDYDLKQMFDAQRKVDEGLAPSFDYLEAKSHAVSDITSTASDRKFMSLPVPATSLPTIALSAIALSVVIGFASWINISRQNEPDVSLASQADLQKLNQACDSLQVKIRELDPETMMKAGTVEQRMDWPTGTDSLIPFATLSFNGRTSP
jgi:hypothetical protein